MSLDFRTITADMNFNNLSGS